MDTHWARSSLNVLSFNIIYKFFYEFLNLFIKLSYEFYHRVFPSIYLEEFLGFFCDVFSQFFPVPHSTKPRIIIDFGFLITHWIERGEGAVQLGSGPGGLHPAHPAEFPFGAGQQKSHAARVRQTTAGLDPIGRSPVSTLFTVDSDDFGHHSLRV